MFDSSEQNLSTPKHSVLVFASIVSLAVIALSISSYLTWNTWQSETVLGCTGSSTLDCDAVLSSHWSKWLGLPVSLFGVLTYVAILAISWPATKQPFGLAGTCLLGLSLLAVGAAVWFVTVQAVFINSFCPYCMGVHACGLVISLLTIFLVRSAPTEIDYDQMGALLGVRSTENTPQQTGSDHVWSEFHPLIATGVSCVGLVLLMGGQLLFSPPTLVLETYDDEELALLEEEEPEDLSFSPADAEPNDEENVSSESPEKSIFSPSSRLIHIKGFRDAFDITEYPIIGNPDASLVFVEMLDYTCKHCRHLHPYIQATIDRYGDQVAFAIYHVPLSKRCNPYVKRDYPGKGNACDYARMALGVSKLTPDKFSDFHDWLMDSEKPPSVGEARRHAMNVAGEEVLIDEGLRQEIAQKLLHHSEVFKASNSGLPMLLTEKGVLRGLPKDEEQWFEILEKQFGIEPAE